MFRALAVQVQITVENRKLVSYTEEATQARNKFALVEQIRRAIERSCPALST